MFFLLFFKTPFMAADSGVTSWAAENNTFHTEGVTEEGLFSCGSGFCLPSPDS